MRLRPHHGLCLLHFVGEGYSGAFTENMAAAAKRLREHPETTVEIAGGSDDLCANCPHRVGTGCESARPPVFDRAVLEASGLCTGQLLSWAQLREKMEPFAGTRLPELCAGCQWLELCLQVREKKNAAK